MPTVYTTDPTTSAVVTFGRMEPIAIAYDFEETINANVHDALWLLTQQWRVGEYKGSDGGTLIKSKIKLKSSKLAKYQLLNQSIKEFTNDVPLNTIVEAVKTKTDLLTRLQTGKHWIKLLKAKISNQTDVTALVNYFNQSSLIQIESTGTDNYADLSDKKLQNILSISAGANIDGERLFLELSAFGIANFSLSSLGLDTGTNDEIDLVIELYKNYFKRICIIQDEEAWDASALEYKFKASAYDGTEETVLIGDNYQSGHIQWYDMDISANPTETLNNLETSQNQEIIEEYIPTPIYYKGMPVERWWEFEDKNIDLASIITNKNDLSKMMIMEFGIIYSNDWFIIPQTLGIGTLNDIETLVVTDVFGKHTLIKSAGAGSNNEWQRWSMFTLNKRGENSHQADTRLFIPPSVTTNIESDPIEQVYFVRDEMANLVWGLEEIIPSSLYGGKRGNIGSNELLQYAVENDLYEAPEQDPAYVENEAELKYMLMNTVPENWIPFIPVQGEGNRLSQFQRGKMFRKINDFFTTDFVLPRTKLLNITNTDTETNPYFINEEEILRPGAVVTATYQRARWTNGEVYTWLGYTKTNGRGESDSGLAFDLLVEK
jgi:hypothetical protein